MKFISSTFQVRNLKILVVVKIVEVLEHVSCVERKDISRPIVRSLVVPVGKEAILRKASTNIRSRRSTKLTHSSVRQIVAQSRKMIMKASCMLLE